MSLTHKRSTFFDKAEAKERKIQETVQSLSTSNADRFAHLDKKREAHQNPDTTSTMTMVNLCEPHEIIMGGINGVSGIIDPAHEFYVTVDNVAFEKKKKELVDDFFAVFGEIKRVLMHPTVPHMLIGYGTEAEAENACEQMDGYELDGRKLSVYRGINGIHEELYLEDFPPDEEDDDEGMTTSKDDGSNGLCVQVTHPPRVSSLQNREKM